MDCCIFIFTRDFRTEDNIGLNYSLKNFKKVIPVFIFSDYFLDKEKNEYFSEKSFEFLKKNIPKCANIFHSKNYGEKILKEIMTKTGANSVVMNKDYTPFAKKREEFFKKTFEDFKTFDDHLLLGELQEPSTRFTHFQKKTSGINVAKPESLGVKICKHKEYKCLSFNGEIEKMKKEKILENIKDNVKDYKNERENILKTNEISKYLKFGLFSIRKLYYYFDNIDFRRQLLWRDFYYSYYYNDEKSLVNGDSQFVLKNIKWAKSDSYLQNWKNGTTGVPIIDASMRCLNETGFLHNRLRMVVASFLVKNLRLNWKEGEKYFSNKLIDIDRVINSGNWQNISSVAKHSQPYFRVFNPWIQSKKYDKDCIFIKKWIGELKDVPAKDIHKWSEKWGEYKTYVKPIIDTQKTAKEFVSQF